MGILGDSFPESFRAEHSQRALEVGSVIRSEVQDTIRHGVVKPKTKYWVIVGIDKDKTALATVYVNTNVNPFIQNRPSLLRAQLLLKVDERNLFEYECYADCTSLQIKSTAEMQQLIEANPGFVRGELNEGELNEIKVRVREATTISKIDKHTFGII